MNKLRKKTITSISRQIGQCRNAEDVEECIALLEDVLQEEQDYYDNIPENLQSGMRAMDSEEAIEHMEEALELLQTAADPDEEDDFADSIAEASSELDEIY